MTVVWAKEPVTAVEVFESLPIAHGWKQKTVNTFLTRLVEKGIAAANKSGKAFVYTARVPRDKCIQAEGESFLQKVFQGSTGDLVLHFCEKAELTSAEIHELEQLLRSKRAKR